MTTEKSRELAEAYHRITAAADAIHEVCCELEEMGEGDLLPALDQIDLALWRVRRVLYNRSAGKEILS